MIRALVLAASLWAGAATAGGADCAPGAVDLVGDFGRARIAVTLAETPEARAQGLMFVERMATFDGMLFIYDRPQSVAFWMKNTLIPLDMIFAGQDGVIRRIHAEAVPGDLTPIPGGEDILAVLEVNGGLAERLGLAEGDVLRHPAFGPDAALPCDAVPAN